MAFPVDAGRATFASASELSTQNVTLPSGIAAGHLLVAAMRETRGRTINTPTGWTQLALNTAAGDRIWVGYRVADGSEGSTQAFTMSSTAHLAAVVWRITSAGVPQISTFNYVAGTTTSLNPPSFTPTGGALDWLWLAFGTNEDGTSLSSYPTNYSNGVFVQSGGSAGAKCSVMGASRQLNAATEDPGAFTIGTGRNNSNCCTIAVAPGAATFRPKVMIF